MQTISVGSAVNAMREKYIQTAVLDYLNTIAGVRVWRANVGASSAEYKGKKRFVRYGVKGQSDISGIGPGGIRIEIEVKVPGNKPTENQEAWLQMIKSHGGIAFWTDELVACSVKLHEQFDRLHLWWNDGWNLR